MSGIKLDNFSTSDVNLTAIMSTAQAMRNGHFALSLTEMDSTTIPKIAAGSIIDLNGQLIYFDADETISGTPVDGVTYIKLIYSSGTVTAEWTSTAPEFDNSKNGWYGTSTSYGHRYITKIIKSSSSYTGKLLLNNPIIPYIYETQTANFSGTWNTGTSKVATLTYASNVLAIKSFDLIANINISESNVRINSVVISSNTIVVTMTSVYGSSVSGKYSMVITAAL